MDTYYFVVENDVMQFGMVVLMRTLIYLLGDMIKFIFID